jgi:hypothetical protein
MVLSLGMHEAGGPLSSPPVPLEDVLLLELVVPPPPAPTPAHPGCGQSSHEV